VIDEDFNTNLRT